MQNEKCRMHNGEKRGVKGETNMGTRMKVCEGYAMCSCDYADVTMMSAYTRKKDDDDDDEGRGRHG